MFKGEGTIFSAGGDLGLLESLTHKSNDENKKLMYEFYHSFLELATLPCPTIAYINGHAVGAGFCFALACDLLYIEEDARVGLNFVKLGISPGMGAEKWLQRLPATLAKELIYTGEIVKASTLAEYGLFNFCAAPGAVKERVSQVLSMVASNSRLAIKLSVPLLRDHTLSYDDVLKAQAENQAQCFANPQVREAIKAVKHKVPFMFSD